MASLCLGEEGEVGEDWLGFEVGWEVGGIAGIVAIIVIVIIAFDEK